MRRTVAVLSGPPRPRWAATIAAAPFRRWSSSPIFAASLVLNGDATRCWVPVAGTAATQCRRWAATAAPPPRPPPPAEAPPRAAADGDSERRPRDAKATAAPPAANPAASDASTAQSSADAHAATAKEAPAAATAATPHGFQAVPAWAHDQLHSTRRMWRAFESWQRGILTGVGVLMGVGGIVFLLWDSFSSDAAQQTKAVASDVLRDKDVRDQAFTATKELVRAVLQDEDAVILLVDVVQRLLATEGSRQSVSLFIKGIFEDKYVQEVTKHFILQIVHDDWVREQLLVVARDLCIDLLQDAVTKQAMTQFLVETSADALSDESLHRKGGSAIKSTVFHSIPGLAWTTGSSKAAAPATPTVPPAPAPAKDAKATSTGSVPPLPAGVPAAVEDAGGIVKEPIR